MHDFKYNESHKSDKDYMMAECPTNKQIADAICQSGMDEEDKALFSTIAMTSCRVSEALATLGKHYKVIDIAGNVVGPDAPNLSHIIITMIILKQKRSKREIAKYPDRAKKTYYKQIPCYRSGDMIPLFDILINYLKSNKKGAEDKVFSHTRQIVWWRCKKYMPEGYWVHLLRHSGATNDLIAQIPISAIQLKLGHKSLNSMNSYLHYRQNEMMKEFAKAYGPTTTPKIIVEPVIQQPVVQAPVVQQPVVPAAPVVPVAPVVTVVKIKKYRPLSDIFKVNSFTDNDLLQVV